jgi:hypothetical protein
VHPAPCLSCTASENDYPVQIAQEPYGPWGPEFNYPAVLHKDHEPDAVYWYHLRREYQLAQHAPAGYIGAAKAVIDPRVPKNFAAAIKDPIWAAAIDKELTKFEVNLCLHAVPDTGQHKVPMMWLFNIKTDGTHKARLVVRGDQMIPHIDFDPNAVYCGNVSACSTKIAAKIAATYQLVKRDDDIVGAYLVTRTSPDFKWYIQTPQGYNEHQ